MEMKDTEKQKIEENLETQPEKEVKTEEKKKTKISKKTKKAIIKITAGLSAAALAVGIFTVAVYNPVKNTVNSLINEARESIDEASTYVERTISGSSYYKDLAGYYGVSCESIQVISEETDFIIEDNVLKGLSDDGKFKFWAVERGHRFWVERSGFMIRVNCDGLVIKIPEGVERIEEKAFFDKTSLVGIILPSSVKSIGSCAFAYTGIEKVIFSKNSKLEEIDPWAFNSCRLRGSIDIPDSVKSIGYGAFGDCYSLIEVGFTVDSQLEEVGNECFKGCTKLKRPNFPEGVKFGRNIFKGTSIDEEAVRNISFSEEVLEDNYQFNK